ncbi:hypothetical protein [Halalkalibacter lacteus]|uniref:hypothetical protein n=1 Tax=Halalkalibacter lacteus TaxID=3090663 RepID=UPI002FC966EF
MNKNQKTTIVFLLLGKSFIAGGLALKNFYLHSVTFGSIIGLVLILIALRFALKWAQDEKQILN